MYPRMFWLVCGIISLTVSVVGCGGNAAREATEAAVNAAQTAITGIQGEAGKYVPDQLSAAQNAIQSANNALAKGDLQTALTDAREAIDKAKVLESASAEKKDELTKDWSRLTNPSQKLSKPFTGELKPTPTAPNFPPASTNKFSTMRKRNTPRSNKAGQTPPQH